MSDFTPPPTGRSLGGRSARLDKGQYTRRAIHDYERIFDRDFVSPGGARMAASLVARLRLEPGQRVLDAGCGLGGTAFAIARSAEVTVDGIDLSHNMLGEARQRAHDYGLDSRVHFEHGDCVQLDRPARYQRIISRDVFLHIADKPRLLGALRAALEAQGLLLFTDYCCGPRPWQPDFTDYVATRGYTLHTLGEYRELLRSSGLTEITVEDLSRQFADELRRDSARIAALPSAYPGKAELAAAWARKRAQVARGELKWCLCTARAPRA